jgi:hypothetical protein
MKKKRGSSRSTYVKLLVRPRPLIKVRGLKLLIPHGRSWLTQDGRGRGHIYSYVNVNVSVFIKLRRELVAVAFGGRCHHVDQCSAFFSHCNP